LDQYESKLKAANYELQEHHERHKELNGMIQVGYGLPISTQPIIESLKIQQGRIKGLEAVEKKILGELDKANENVKKLQKHVVCFK
jgi:hypothetical protein